MWCRFCVQFLTALQCVALLALCLCAASVYVSPAKIPWLSVFVLGFPFLLVGVVLIGVLALIFTPRRSWISLLALVLCCGSIRNYVPINFSQERPLDSWHVMSWNLGMASMEDSARTALTEYLQHSELDILCSQETAGATHLTESLKYRMPYSSIGIPGGTKNGSLCLSRWPIVKCENLLDGGYYHATVYSLLLAPQDTLLVINCHLESMRLSGDQRKSYHAIVRREQVSRDTVEATSKTLFQHFRESGSVRAMQADTIADFIAAHADSKMLVMGDFNDTPISYTRQRLFRAGVLEDAFRESGNGVGRTFNRDAIFVRIDHILYSARYFRAYQAKVEPTQLSDHNPIEAYIKPQY